MLCWADGNTDVCPVSTCMSITNGDGEGVGPFAATAPHLYWAEDTVSQSKRKCSIRRGLFSAAGPGFFFIGLLGSFLSVVITRRKRHKYPRCKKEGGVGRRTAGHRDGWADGRTHRQTDRQTDGRTDGRTDRRTGEGPRTDDAMCRKPRQRHFVFGGGRLNLWLVSFV